MVSSKFKLTKNLETSFDCIESFTVNIYLPKTSYEYIGHIQKKKNDTSKSITISSGRLMCVETTLW